MPNKAYDILKFISLIIAPVATFTAAIAQTWNIPYGAQITATIAAADILMGAIVTIAKAFWDKDHQEEKETGGDRNG